MLHPARIPVCGRPATEQNALSAPTAPQRRSVLTMTDLRFADDRDASRYTLHDGDDLVSVLDYRDDGRTIALTRAFTIPTFRGRGYAEVVVERAVDAIERAGNREILPVCWYVGEWFEAHPERASLLHARS
jgi:predicted GNAT family acetyltransferase